MNDIEVAELATQQNGSGAAVGTSGLPVYWGHVMKADNVKLQWPECEPLYTKFLRRDPQVAQWLYATSSMASKVDWHWELVQKKPTDTDKRFLEFLNSIWDDLPGGQRELIDTYNHYRLMGWEWFENVKGRRNGMKAPRSDWVSVYDDGLIGLQGVAWRDHSSFSKWDIDERTGKTFGFVQMDYPNPEVTIPLGISSHIKLGDPTSPEGLSPFEALWRLESFMYNLEIVLGIGSEHSAGHAKFQSEQKLTPVDQTNIKDAARALQSAVEGNYLALPGHINADIIDVPFSAGPSILTAIQYYGHLKAQILGIQWMSLSLTSDAGSNASMQTSAKMWLAAFNNDMNGGAQQFGRQIATQLRDANDSTFGAVKRLPVLKATPVEADIDLLQLAQFVSAMSPVMDDWTAEDWAAVRRRSGFLPEIEVIEIQEDEDEPMDNEPDEAEQDDTQTDDTETTEGDSEADREFAQIVANGGLVRTMVDGKETVVSAADFAHPVAIGKNQPTVTTGEDLVDLDDPESIEKMIKRIEDEFGQPLLGALMRAEASDE